VKDEGKLFVYGAVFYLMIAAIYGFWSRDIAGIVLLLLAGCMACLIGFFVLHTGRRVFPRPEDVEDGNQEDADIDYGFFSPHSWWPLPVAFSTMIICFGLAFAWWIVAVGIAFLMLSLVGFVFEYYRGDHAH
jgi:hypothetical protein